MSRRLGAAIVAIALIPAIFLASSGCTSTGQTPDCTIPNNQCGPALDGSPVEASEAAQAETGPDAATDGAADAPVDTKIDGDAGAG